MVLPKTDADVQAALAIAREAGVSVVARGGGTSQAGQTIGPRAGDRLFKYLNQHARAGRRARTVWVEPGLVLDRLNRLLQAARPVLPGRHLDQLARDAGRHGRQQRLRRALDPLRHHGRQPARDRCAAWRTARRSVRRGPRQPRGRRGQRALSAAGPGHAGARRARGGRRSPPAFPRSSAGSAATISTGSGRRPQHGRAAGRLRGHARPVPRPQAQAAAAAARTRSWASATFRASTRRWRRPSDRRARAASAVELVDRSIIELGRQIPAYRPLIDRFVRGTPDALLLVEFAGDEPGCAARRPARLKELMARSRPAGRRGRGGRARCPGPDLGGAHRRAQHRHVDEERRQAGLVHRGLRRAARAPRRLHGAADRDLRPPRHQRHLVRARLGRLPARPPDPQPQAGAGRARDAPDRRGGDGPGPRLQGQPFGRARRRPGALGVPRGDVRSAARCARSRRSRTRSIPKGVLNPGKIVRAPRMDDRNLLRFRPGYAPLPIRSGLDWQAWGGFLGAAEMCNNNGACRKAEPGVMCPSYRVTRDETAPHPRPRQQPAPRALAASSGRTRSSRTRWRRPSTSASPARPAGGNARPGSTWRG